MSGFVGVLLISLWPGDADKEIQQVGAVTGIRERNLWLRNAGMYQVKPLGKSTEVTIKGSN